MFIMLIGGLGQPTLKMEKFRPTISPSYVPLHTKSFQSCRTLCDSVDCSPPGSWSMHLQARVHEWVAISFSR